MEEHHNNVESNDNYTSESCETGIIKTVPIIRDFSLNPSCAHGPTILFERNGKRYFSCSAFRSRQLCQFFMPEEKWVQVQARARDTQTEDGPKNGKIVVTSMKGANSPFLNPTQRNKGEAQYHFNEKTSEFFMTQLRNLKFDGVLCIGAPSLHQQVIADKNESLRSFLLDIDVRFDKMYNNEGFSLYNMCNHHFFRDKSKYLEFLSNSKKLAIIMDPPFGVKVELLYHGCLKGVQNDFNKIHSQKCKDKSKKIEVFWIFPYFMEGHIYNKCSEAGLKMSDFHVEYRNHPKYNGGPRNKSSPIRIFTTVPLAKLSLPDDEYRYCSVCAKWVDKQNLHCELCGVCSTKDGGKTYTHCMKCEKCVKPSWAHCKACGVCHLNQSDQLDTCSQRESAGSSRIQNHKRTQNKIKNSYYKVSQLKQKNKLSVSIRKKDGNVCRNSQFKRKNK